MNTMADQCVICVDRMNQTSRRPVTCFACDKTACARCIKRVLTGTAKVDHCMFCQVVWSYNFLTQVLPSSWLAKEYKVYHSKRLLDMEILKCPKTQEACRAFVDLRSHKDALSNNQQEIKTLTILISALYAQRWNDRLDNVKLFQCTQGILQAEADLAYRKSLNKKLNHAVLHYRSLYYTVRDDVSHQRQVKSGCPYSGCRGFIWTDNRCGLCNRAACKECQRVQTENHICNPDDMLSISRIMADSKPCPSCNVPITKIDGCNQMWCTRCHCTFSWHTGLFERLVDNPHYNQWMRSRNLPIPRRDLPECEPLVGTAQTFYDSVRRIEETSMSSDEKSKAHYLLCRMNDLLLQVRIPTQRSADPNIDDRILYMLNKIGIDTFRSRIFARERKLYKETEYRTIYNTVIDVCEDLLHQIFTGAMAPAQFFQTLVSLEQIANEALQNVPGRYSGLLIHLLPIAFK